MNPNPEPNFNGSNKKCQYSQAIKRLHRDYAELKQLDLPTIAAEPLECDFFVWHANVLVPYTSDYRGAVFHLVIHFPSNYPKRPPSVHLKSVPIHHSHVYGTWICLDMLETHESSESFYGWSSAYTVASILLQLQSFFLDEEHLLDMRTIKRDVLVTNNYACNRCMHDARNFKYWPWKESWSDKVTFDHPGHCELIPGKRMKVERRKNYSRRHRVKVGNGRNIATEKFNAVQKWIKRRNHAEKLRQRLRKQNYPRWNRLTIEEIEDIFAEEVQQKNAQFEQERIQREKEERLRKEQQMKREMEKQRCVQKLKGWDCSDVIRTICSFLNSGTLSTTVQEINLTWAEVAHKQLGYTHLKEAVKCFFLKTDAEDDVLGIGVSLTKYKNKKPGFQYVSSTFDLISYTAYNDLNVRLTVWNHKFTHWVPLMITRKHADKSWPFMEKSIALMYGDFKPSHILDFTAKLMNSMIVSVMNGDAHASIAALEGYTHCHRILVEALLRYPSLQEEIDSRIERFIASEDNRIKSVCPSIGDLLPLVSVSSFGWSDVADAIVSETRDRNALWILKKYPDIEGFQVSAEERVHQAFDACQVSLRLLCYHRIFLTQVARPDAASLEEVAQMTDETYGKPLTCVVQKFQKIIFDIQSISFYKEALLFLQFKPEDVTVEKMNNMLVGSFQNSLRKEYHTPSHNLKVFNLPHDMTPLKLYAKIKNNLFTCNVQIRSIHVLSNGVGILQCENHTSQKMLLEAKKKDNFDDIGFSTRCTPFTHTPSGEVKSIFVRGCSSPSKLSRVFSKCGKINKIIPVRGACIIEFASYQTLESALLYDGHIVDSETYIRVKESSSKKASKKRTGFKNSPNMKEDGWQVVKSSAGRGRKRRNGWRSGF